MQRGCFSKNIHEWGWISGLSSSKAHVLSIIYIQSFLNLEESFQIFRDVTVKLLWKGVDDHVHWCGFVIAGKEFYKNTFSTQIFQGYFWSLTLDATSPVFHGWFMKSTVYESLFHAKNHDTIYETNHLLH